MTPTAYLSLGVMPGSYAESQSELGVVAVRTSVSRFWRSVIDHPLACLRSGSNLLLAPAMFAVRRTASHSVGVGKLLKRALLVKKGSTLSAPRSEDALDCWFYDIVL
jgi:hypothetical protein